MVSQIKYSNTIIQTTTDNTVSFNDLNNLKNGNNTYSKTGKIGGKTSSKKRIPKLVFTNFGFDIPVGAEVTMIQIQYAHQKLDYVQGKYPSISGPEIYLKNVGTKPAEYITKKGAAPTSQMADKTVSFNGSVTAQTNVGNSNNLMETQTITIENAYAMPSRTVINNPNFGVEFRYPENTSANEGYLQLKYVRIAVFYKETNYGLKISRLENDDILVWDVETFKIEVTNINLTKYQPGITITLPSDAVVVNMSGDVGVVSTEGNVLSWSPTGMRNVNNVGSTAVGTWTLNLDLTFTSSGTKTISAVEDLHSTTAELSGIVVSPIPTTIEGTTDLVDEERILYVKKDTSFNATITVPKDYLLQEGISKLYLFTNKTLTVNGSSLAAETAYQIPLSNFNDDGEYVITFMTGIVSETYVYISTENSLPQKPYFQIRSIPSDYTYPELTIYKLSDEEIARLGDGYSYTVVADAMLITGNADYIEDHYRNYRLGVVNSINATANLQNIFNACHCWSQIPSTINNYEEISVDFVFDEKYPVYIIFTGDYHEFEYYVSSSFRFSTPNMFQKDTEYIKEYAVFPEPLMNILTDNNEAIGSMQVQEYKSSNSLIFYDLGFGEGFGTNDHYAIRGIQVELEADVTSQIIANAFLRNVNGVMGQESIVLTPGVTSYIIGGEFDTWGFNIGNISDLDKWEVELIFSNIIEGTSVDMDITSVRVIAYYLPLQHYKEQIYVDGENLEWYGAFVQEFNVPFGAKTDTKYLTVFGTDINDGYNMSIKEKEITLKFDVTGCTLAESTELLKQIAVLLSNKRDELNRPIPKRIQSSFDPSTYYEYILEDGIDADPTNGADYECTAKLTVPAGTSYKVDDTVTNVAGVVNSIAKVNPKIVFIPQSDTIEILEEYTQQKFNMGYTGWNGMYVEIDCVNQKVWLRETENATPKNISSMVDFNVDWFCLDGVYRFIPTNCMIQTVSFSERGS